MTGDGGELLFLPLGGSGEIGMNLNLYHHAGKWLMVDLGITFSHHDVPGVDVLMPDIAFIEERAADLVGLVVTHAHEDHVGAVPYLWPRLRCPVYTTGFTASVLRRKLREMDKPIDEEVPINEIPLGGRFSVGPFDIELITLTHSIPEPEALVIRTGAGAVLHTGDWKLDPDPLVGPLADEAALRRIGDEGVLAMVCDSTNVFRPGHSGSEGELRKSLLELVKKQTRRVAIACFASNIARLETIAEVARGTGRHAALVGRSLWRMYDAARENGYLLDAGFLHPAEAAYLPPEKVVLACTGSQGEPRAALPRIIADDHPDVVLERGDSVIFSSRIIPGNERDIFRLQNRLVELGIDVITEEDHFVHVSGHPNREELVRMYQWVRPRVAVPVHGEVRHIREHAALARECQVQRAVEARNGAMIRLAPGPAEVVGEVPSGRLALDGNRLVAMDSPAFRSRNRMAWSGVAVATLVLDEWGQFLREPELTVHGLADGEEDAKEAREEVLEAIRAAIEAMPRGARTDDSAVREIARRAIRRSFRDSHGKRPSAEVHLVRL